MGQILVTPTVHMLVGDMRPRDDNPGAGIWALGPGPGRPKDPRRPSIKIPGERGNSSQNPPGWAPGWENFESPGISSLMRPQN